MNSLAYLDQGTICSGFGPNEEAKIFTPNIQCSSLYGTPWSLDNSQSTVREPDSNWTQPIHICATGIRASVKKVDFGINGTAALNNLQVIGVQDRTYSDKSSMPLWAVERTGLNISSVDPLWGIVDNEYEDANGFWTYRGEKLWLPATSLIGMYHIFDSLAGTGAPGRALMTTITTAAGPPGIRGDEITDYSGLRNFRMFLLWQQLSEKSSSASQIINLIFTDILASATVGTKSLISSSDKTALAKWPVTEYVKGVQYNFLFAIPASVVIVLWVIVMVLATSLWIMSRFSIAHMRQALNQTSVGRVATNILHQDLCDPAEPTVNWIQKAGSTTLDFTALDGKKLTLIAGSDTSSND